ncbi:MAG: DMT family transporter [Bacteroidaceae bacterium]|nr:DMT family transporter [Bacteroidaceae bacterium]
MYKGELISIAVATSWTACAMFAEVASKRMGSLPFNVVRMTLSLLMLAGVMWFFTGMPYPVGADASTWFWLSLSGFVGYVLGDFCLFNSYILIGSRYGQLLMTIAPPAAAVFGWMILGQSMSWIAILGMCVTSLGIATAIYRPKKDKNERIPLKGILFGIGAGIGQGIGLVLSAKGLLHYEATVQSMEIEFMHGASTSTILPFASTAIRAVTGLIGFSIWTVINGEQSKLKEGIRDHRTMLAALGATITGPFIGVSLSLMATLYTSIGIAQTIMALTPVLIILPTYLFFHQKILLREVIGAVISVCGVALFFIN